MIDADDFLNPALQAGFNFYTGVPCSFLTPIINRVICSETTGYIAAASEGEAVGIAAGAWLAGKLPVIMCQNSGLGNAVNPLTSLNYPFKIPALLIVTWRGAVGLDDEPQHQLMGQITKDILNIMRVPYGMFPNNKASINPAIEKAISEITKNNLPYAMLMKKGSIQNEEIQPLKSDNFISGELYDWTTSKIFPSRVSAIKNALEILPSDVGIISTTGYTGRELYEVADREQHLYQVGSMGCAAGMGFGIAINSEKNICVFDGDGAALMKLGTMATVGAYKPKNFIHILFDNGTYQSTGGQPTVSSSINFAKIAIACGYRFAFSCNDLTHFNEALNKSKIDDGPTLIHMRVRKKSLVVPGRPKIGPAEVAARFRDFLAQE